MHILIRTTLTLLLTTVALNAQAGLKQLGMDFRTMMSNYAMTQAIQKRCPDITLPEIKPRTTVERAMQQKLGIENYIQLMMKIGQSDDTKNAFATIDKLWDNIEGCQDPELAAALQRIAKVHDDAYTRFASEPGLVKPKDVPVPLRR